jgi:FMN phosphatase YigB (HAD superfamily)
MQITVTAAEIASLCERAPAGVNILSLDCFDTLVWRNTQAPRDVFAEFPIPGGGVEPRMWAEGAARRAQAAATGKHEITIEQIHARLDPGTDPAIGVAAECAMEARHCYGFAPVAQLMRAAKLRGWRVIIVSDTYLGEGQLRDLISAAAGDDVAALIDHVFASSHYGVSKGDGLFQHVLAELKVAPGSILHLGDNRIADQVAPSVEGINTAHFRQFAPEVEQRLRHEASAAQFIDPTARVTTPIHQPHRPILALREDCGPAEALGHDVLGPVLATFADWVKAEADAMAARTGRPVKPVFLLRDGHLPKAVFDARHPDAGAVAVEISRFAAAAASLIDRDALDRYVTDAVERMRPERLGRQLLLHGNEIAPLAKKGDRGFRKGVLAPEVARRILKRAEAYGDRLARHLTAQGVVPGEAVMLVDLGYNGSVQTLVEPFLRAKLNLEVAGRYLLLREETPSGLDKAGLIDRRHYETRLLQAMCGCVAVLEQLCTVAQGSVVDYAADGTPIRQEAGIKGAQSAIRDAAQAACVTYAKADPGVTRAATSDDADARRCMAAATLARLLFLPSGDEVALFETFDHDENLGTRDTVKLLDVAAAGAGLRRRGLGYMAATNRMFVPGELQRHGLPLNLSLFAANRFGLDLRNADFEVGGVDVPVILADAADHSLTTFTARPTAEGYYRLAIPIGAGRYTAAVQLGAVCAWVQVDAARFVPLKQFDSNVADAGTPAVTVADAMTAAAPDLYEAQPNGLLLVPPPAGQVDLTVLEIVFRPIVWREQAEADVQARAA